MKLALSILCENPARPTGLSTLYPALVRAALRLFPDVDWVVFAGPRQSWDVVDPSVEVVRDFPANDRPGARLWADHFAVGPAAAARGAHALLTTGFVPARSPLPVAMQVITLHHLRADFGGGALRRWYRQRALSSGLARAALVVANSQNTADRLVEECGADRRRVLVSPEGVDHQRFHPRAEVNETEELQRRWQLAPGFVLWASNFYSYKHAERLVAAYARVPAALRARHPLVMIGADWHGGRARALQVAQEAGVESQVRVLDWVEDRWLPAFYRHALVHALPSVEESFGRSVLEAMACGCPCVVNDIRALAEVGADAVVKVNFADAEAASAALEDLLESGGAGTTPLYAELKGKGLKRAADFSFERLARERIGALRSLLGGNP